MGAEDRYSAKYPSIKINSIAVSMSGTCFSKSAKVICPTLVSISLSGLPSLFGGLKLVFAIGFKLVYFQFSLPLEVVGIAVLPAISGFI